MRALLAIALALGGTATAARCEPITARPWAARDSSPQERWRVPTETMVSAAPAVHGGAVYVGDWGGRFRAIELATGRIRWTCSTRGAIAGPPAGVDDSLVVFSSADSFVRALDPRTGRLQWTFPLPSSYADQYGPLLGPSMVFVGSALGMHALDRASGRVRWQVVTDGRPLGRPALVGDTLFFATMRNWVDSTRTDGYAYAIDAGSGGLIWRRFLPAERGFLGGARAGVVVAAGLIVVPCASARVVALDRATGEQRWACALHQPALTACGIDDSTVYAGSLEGEVVAIDARSGRARWRTTVRGSIGQGPISIADGLLVLSSGDSHAYVFDVRDGSMTCNRKGALNPVIHEHTLYCGGFDADLNQNFISALAITPDSTRLVRGGTP